MNESEFLANESADAKAAMQNSITELKQTVLQAADVRMWTRDYPWASVSSALLAGFGAAALVTPRRDESIREHLAKVAGSARGEANSEPKRKRRGWISRILWQLFAISRITLGNQLLAQFHARMDESPPPPDEEISPSSHSRAEAASAVS